MIVMTVTHALARPLRDLRISVTDRCNFRCVYCMPREVFGRDYEFLERAELLTFEEIERLARILVGDHGVSKIRLTGGEPLVRREVERLVEMLARIPGLGDLAMTTNGSALARKARALGDAGLRRITVSLDSLDNEVFAAINDVGFPVERVRVRLQHDAGALLRRPHGPGACARGPRARPGRLSQRARDDVDLGIEGSRGGRSRACRHPGSSPEARS
jgi:cyclic pyranopterin phosphate synthase